MPSVTTAAEMLTLAAEHGGPVEFARIATLQAINRHRVRQFTDRKDPRWGADGWRASNDKTGRNEVRRPYSRS